MQLTLSERQLLALIWALEQQLPLPPVLSQVRKKLVKAAQKNEPVEKYIAQHARKESA